MNVITIIGRLGRDAAVKTTQQGTKFITLALASDERYKGENVTAWYDVLTYDVESYERMLPYLTKGSSVIVYGELFAEMEIGSDGKARCRRSVRADNIRFLPTGKKSDDNAVDAANVAFTSSPRTPRNTSTDTPDDIPMGTTAPRTAPVGTVTAATTGFEESDASDDLPF